MKNYLFILCFISGSALAQVTLMNRSGKKAQFTVVDGAFKTHTLDLESGDSKNLDTPRRFEVSFAPFGPQSDGAGTSIIDGCPATLVITGGGTGSTAQALSVRAVAPFAEPCKQLQLKNQTTQLVHVYLRSGSFYYDRQIPPGTTQVVAINSDVTVSSSLSGEQKLKVSGEKRLQVNLDCDDQKPCVLELE